MSYLNLVVPRFQMVKRRQICQTLLNAATWTERKGKTAALPKRQNDLSHVLCAPLAVQAQCSCFIIILPLGLPVKNFAAKFGVLDPSKNRNRCLEILHAAGAMLQLCSKGTFEVMNQILSLPWTWRNSSHRRLCYSNPLFGKIWALWRFLKKLEEFG